jgi:prepilin-type processing-associated H-X9-DG protein
VADTILDDGSGNLQLAQVAAADGSSNTLLYGHKFVQPQNYYKINVPPFSPWDNKSVIDAGWAADAQGTIYTMAGTNATYQPSGASTVRGNWNSHHCTSSLIQDINHNLDYTAKLGSGTGYPVRADIANMQIKAYEGGFGGPHPNSSPMLWGDGSVRSLAYGLDGTLLCAMWGWNDGVVVKIPD